VTAGIAVEVEVFVDCGLLVDVLVRVGEGVLSGVEVRVGVGVLLVGTIYSICNKGAAVLTPLYASAVRVPVPPIITTMEFPADQPGRFMIA
jgi:hypothetical protein